MNASMATKNTAGYFNILAPGEDEVAMFNGSVSDNQFEGILPQTGDYKVRVYMMRSAARREEVANYRLELIITDAGKSAADAATSSPRGDALLAGTNYHATGSVPCSMGTTQPDSACSYSVVREGNGSGMVTVTKKDGSTRSSIFEAGKAIGYDVSQSDHAKFIAEKQGDESIVRIGEERYEIPDAVIYGG